MRTYLSGFTKDLLVLHGVLNDWWAGGPDDPGLDMALKDLISSGGGSEYAGAANWFVLHSDIVLLMVDDDSYKSAQIASIIRNLLRPRPEFVQDVSSLMTIYSSAMMALESSRPAEDTPEQSA